MNTTSSRYSKSGRRRLGNVSQRDRIERLRDKNVLHRMVSRRNRLIKQTAGSATYDVNRLGGANWMDVVDKTDRRSRPSCSDVKISVDDNSIKYSNQPWKMECEDNGQRMGPGRRKGFPPNFIKRQEPERPSVCRICTKPCDSFTIFPQLATSSFRRQTRSIR